MTDQPFESRIALERFVLESLDDMVALLKVVDHSQRLKILTIMLNKEMSFNLLQEATSLQKSALSNHLAILIKRNLIEKIERGEYRLTEDAIALIMSLAQSYLEIKVREQERLLRIQRLIGKYTIYGDESNLKDDLDVRIKTLSPMRVASVQAISKSPESEAWGKMKPWAEKMGLLDNTEKYPIFGFNNPDPSPDKEEYGYEFWIKIGSDIVPPPEFKVKEIKSGLYAVTTTRPIISDENIIPAWKRLAEWVKNNKKYDFGSHQLLEKHLNPRAPIEELILDLYCPIKEV
ncbi:GyrI-like domain-containing protein [Candidatus Hodarchaeum mangrovi]